MDTLERPKAVKSPSQKRPPQLDECEWNFEASKVPDSELKACFFFEFAREFAKASAAYRSGMAALTSAWTKRTGWLRKMGTVLSLFDKVPRAVREQCCSFELPAVFPETPWRKLAPTVRHDVAKLVEKEAAGPAGFKESVALLITLERELELPEWRAAGVTGFPSWVLPDRCFHSDAADQREHGFIALNWNYTDTQLAEQFKNWLKAMRGERKPCESQQGKTKFRQYLWALGATRLLKAGFTAEKAMAETQRFLKDSAGNACPLYDAVRSWYMAKRTVERVLITLFPSATTAPR